MTDAATIDGAGREGSPFPFRDLLVARTYEPRADAGAMLVARALAERMAGVVVIRAERESLIQQAEHAVVCGVRDDRDAVCVNAGRSDPGAACLRIAEGPVGPSLRRAGLEVRAALVAVGACRRRPLAASIFGSVARDVRRNAERPVLVCPHEPAAALRLDTPA